MYFWRLILNKRVTFMPIACFAFSPVSISAFFQFSSGDIGMTVTCISVACFIFLLFAVNALFQFLGYSIGKKWITGWTNGHNLLKNILFQLNFQYSLFLLYMHSVSVLRLWHRYAHFHCKRSSKWMNLYLKNNDNSLKR